jgi:hypothetical protein
LIRSASPTHVHSNGTVVPPEIQMNIRSFVLPLVCAACRLAYGATPYGASELRLVTVGVPAVGTDVRTDIRTDIRTACPEIDAQLQQSFSSAWGHVHRAQTIPVQFRVEGHRVTQTRTSIAFADYRPYLRAAMATLDCTVASGQAQDFKFLLVMLDPDDRSPSAARRANAH